MAFTTIQGSGANDATSFVGSAGVDVLPLVNQNLAYAGGQQSGDTITFSNFTTVNAQLTLKGGQGNDTITSAANNLFSSGLINGNKNNDTITLINSNLATVYGGQGNDTFTLTAAGTITNTLINGNKDNDTINGTAGVSFAASSLFGGQGIDSINANQGATGSLIQGDLDSDTITVGVNITGSTVNGNAGNDTIDSQALTTDMSSATIYGGAGNDTLTGTTSGAVQILSGDAGNDSVSGGTDTDTLLGGANNDTIDGNASADAINVGSGSDNLIYNDADTQVGVIANGTSLAQADVITGMGVGDSVNLNGLTNGTFTAITVGVAYTAANANNVFLVQGTLNNGAFTAGNAATDVDYLFQFVGGAGATDINSAVFDNVGAGVLTGATFAGNVVTFT